MKRRRQDDPSYDEAQATAWLAWLAQGMQQHGQTIFLIEQLQPSWLSTHNQRSIYIMTSRLIWGVICGLITGLIVNRVLWISDLRELGMLIVALIGGLFLGLILGLIDVVRFAQKRSHLTQHASGTLRQIIAGSLLFGLIGVLVGVPIFLGLGSGPDLGLVFGLVFGLIVGPFWILRSFGRTSRNEIQTVETLRFSRAYMPKGIVNGLIGGLIIGLFFGLIFILMVDIPTGGWLTSDLFFGLTIVLYFGLIVGLTIWVLSCFRPGVQELKTIPNQGIWLSLRSAGLMGGVGGLGLGLIVGLLFGWTGGLVYGSLGGLCIGLWYGGLDVIQNTIVRILLWRADAMPRDYVRFLNYAAEELNFLQKVGGGYMFVHRYLLEYFAEMELPGKPSLPVDTRALYRWSPQGEG